MLNRLPRSKNGFETGPEPIERMPGDPPFGVTKDAALASLNGPTGSPSQRAENMVAKPAGPAVPQSPDRWGKVDHAIDAIEHAIRYGHGKDVVGDALDEAAEQMARHVDLSTPDDFAKRRDAWRLRLRKLTNMDGSHYDKASFMRLRGDVAAAQIKTAATAQHGVVFGRDSRGNYVLRSASGDPLMSLASGAGANLARDPDAFQGQLALLRAAYGRAESDALYARALAVFSDVHERDRDHVDIRAITRPTEDRARAFVSATESLRIAQTAEERDAALKTLRIALFAEADSSDGMFQFVADMFSPVGRANAAFDFADDVSDAYVAVKEGRYLDGGASAFWALMDGVGAVGGIRFGKVMKGIGQRLPLAKRIIAARDIARKEANAAKQFETVNAEAMLGARLWNRYDADSQEYLQGLLNAAKGAVGEEAVRKQLTDLKANPARGVGKAEGEGRELTGVDLLGSDRFDANGKLLKKRFYDEILNDTELQSLFGMFLWPASTPGKKTRIEVKVDGAVSDKTQALKDERIGNRKNDYKTHDLVLLRVPYDEIAKLQLRKQAIAWMRSPDGAGMRRIEGIDRYRTVNGKRVVVRRDQWSEAHFERMIKDVDHALKLQAALGARPTVADFISGLAARVAVVSERESTEQK